MTHFKFDVGAVAEELGVGQPAAGDLVQVGWVRWDGDEFHDFYYSRQSDEYKRHVWPVGFLPVFARSVDAEGSVPAHSQECQP